MIKLIACDMDGTLLDSHHQMLEANVFAIQAAMNSGVRFVISTGRDYSTVIDLLNEHHIKCDCILLNGAKYIDEEGTLVAQTPLSLEHVKKIYEVFEKENIYYQLFCGDDIYSLQSVQDIKIDFKYRLSEHRLMSDKELDDFLKDTPFFNNMRLLKSTDDILRLKKPIYKMEAYRHQSVGVENARRKLSALEGIAVASSFKDNIEVTAAKATKGAMLEKVAARYGIMHNEVMVIGDSDNDISMAQRFPNSIAMKNATASLKAVSTMITDSNDDAGVARAIFKMIRQNERLKAFEKI